MNCKRISKELSSYLDGRASPDERRRVETHLEACGGCRDRFEELRRLWNVLDEVPVVGPSLGFDARVRQRIAAEPRPRAWSWLVPSPRLAFAAAVLLVLSTWIALRPPVFNLQNSAANSEEDFRMIKDLGVLENYDVLSNFDALSELPVPSAEQQPNPSQEQEQQQQPDGGQMER